MKKVFISHSSQDRVFVEDVLIPILKEHSIVPWYSKDDIAITEKWEESIKRNLKESEWIIIVLSPNAIKSDWVKAEVHWAIETKPERIIPILYEECDAIDLHLKLPRIQYVDFVNSPQDWQEKLLRVWGKGNADQPAVKREDDPVAGLNGPVVNIVGKDSEKNSSSTIENSFLTRFINKLSPKVVLVIVGAVVLFACWTNVLDIFLLDTYSKRGVATIGEMISENGSSQNTIRIIVNDSSYFENKYDWRGKYAKLIEKISVAGAKVIAFDVYFATSSNSDDNDDMFNLAAKMAHGRGTSVIVGINKIIDNELVNPAFLGENFGYGILCLGRKLNHVVEAPLIVFKNDNKPFPSIALKAVEAFVGNEIVHFDKKEKNIVIGDSQYEQLTTIDFSSAKSVESFQNACPVIESGDKVASIYLTPPENPYDDHEKQVRFSFKEFDEMSISELKLRFSDKIVLIGVKNKNDTFKMSKDLDSYEFLGVDIHARTVETLLSNKAFKHLSIVGHAIIIIICMVVSYYFQKTFPHPSKHRQYLIPVGLIIPAGLTVLFYQVFGLIMDVNYLYLSIVSVVYLVAKKQRVIG